MILDLLDMLRRDGPTIALVYAIGWALAIVLGIALHEFAHAFVAYRLGDVSQKYSGRLTIDPRAHFDPFGTIFILLAGVGYGRPVGVNPSRFRMDRHWGMALVSIAGPITNILIAIVFALGVRALFLFAGPDSPLALSYAIAIFSIVILVNISLALFNMIPFPPLDGSKVLLALLPPDMANRLEHFYLQTQQFGLVGFLLIIWALGRFIGPVLAGPQNALFELLVGPR